MARVAGAKSYCTFFHNSKLFSRIDLRKPKGFALAKNTKDPIYVEMAKFPEGAKRFTGGMSTYFTGEGYELNHINNGYPWASVQGMVVDVGGSHGNVSVALAQAFPTLHFVLQDLPKTISACSGIGPSEVGSSASVGLIH